MDPLGFKFTFYIKSFEPNKENLSEKTGKNLPVKSIFSKNHGLCDIANSTVLRSNRPSTHRNYRMVAKSRNHLDTQRCKIDCSEIPRSKSFLQSLNGKENLNKNPKSCNAIKLLPVVHHYKKPRQNSEFLVHAIKLRLPNKLV